MHKRDDSVTLFIIVLQGFDPGEDTYQVRNDFYFQRRLLYFRLFSAFLQYLIVTTFT